MEKKKPTPTWDKIRHSESEEPTKKVVGCIGTLIT
jgi:hypothetical protein